MSDETSNDITYPFTLPDGKKIVVKAPPEMEIGLDFNPPDGTWKVIIYDRAELDECRRLMRGTPADRQHARLECRDSVLAKVLKELADQPELS